MSTETPPPLVRSREAAPGELREAADAGRLYAVLDACDTPSVPETAREVGDARAVSLYRGSAEEMYWAVAPYLFSVDGALLDWIVETLWAEPFGIFAVADDDLETLRRHFRRFLMVRSPEGAQWYFRYYDPRVLPTFLESANAEELREVFGPLRAYAVPAVAPGATRIFSPAEGLGPGPRIRIRRLDRTA